jgi:methionyl-tRNA formyltransferase
LNTVSSLRLGFAGTPQFAVAALDGLTRSGLRVVAVFTRPDRPSGRGRSVHSSAVKQRALELEIPVYQPASFNTPDAADLLRKLELDALVVVAYGMILPAAVLSIPVLGCFNIHASLLPRWRGAAPIQRALLAGDAVTGITIMRMEAGLDTGPTLAVREVAVRKRETAGSLHDRLAELGAELIVEVLPAVVAGTAALRPQPAAGVTYAPKVGKQEALIDWHEDAANLERRVRAFNPWPIAETRLNGAQLRVWDAELAPVPPDRPPGAVSPGIVSPGLVSPGTILGATTHGIDVACGRGALRVLRLQLPGRKPLAAREFITAQQLDGVRLGPC